MTSSQAPSIGKPLDRVDGRLKVMGKATYSAEWQLPGLTYAVIVESPISRGHITRLDTRQAEAAPGVITVLTHLNARPAKVIGGANEGSPAQQKQGPKPVPDPSLVLHDEFVRYSGQPIALVVARSLEEAREGARLVRAQFHKEVPDVALDDHLSERYAPEQIFGEPPDKARGDFEAGWAAADVRVDEIYVTSAESHNPMEPHATTAVYHDGRLTLYDATQYVYGVKRNLAHVLNLPPEKVRVVCRYVGGGFGSKGMQWPHVTLAAMAAMHVGKPVKLVVERRQMFGLVGFRPRTHQRVRLAAKRDGTLTAIGHDGTSQTSRFGEFVEPVASSTRILYACANLSVSHRLVKLDTQTPTFQRAPGEASGSCAVECALDELAYHLAMDPLALRQKNYATRDPDKDRPWSSKALDECYRKGAEAFGWARRPMQPGTMKEGHVLVGWGMATATYPTHRMGASARVRISADGRALVQTASHDLGTGTYTILTQVAADALGLAPASVHTELGDTDYPEAPVSGGSMSAASASSAVHAAAGAAREALLLLALGDTASPLHGLDASAVGWGEGHFHVLATPALRESYTTILERHGKTHVEAERLTKPGQEQEAYGMHAWGAQFAEVKVDPLLGTVRVSRMVGAFAGGRVLNPKTARSQLLGGMVMGIGMALLEEVVRDPRQGRVVNGSLADYLVPVNADVPPLEVILIHEDDPHVNPLGIKGLGELGIVGAGAAIANAVYHATGKRIREFPLTIEKLL